MGESIYREKKLFVFLYIREERRTSGSSLLSVFFVVSSNANAALLIFSLSSGKVSKRRNIKSPKAGDLIAFFSFCNALNVFVLFFLFCCAIIERSYLLLHVVGNTIKY